jgi:hypothetical protein
MIEQANCRHEYVKIFQRKLKGLERRLLSTRAYLPTGFKQADFGHLGEGSFCFCTKCRTRLYPKRTQQERLAARAALAASQALDKQNAELQSQVDEAGGTSEIHVEELVLESPDFGDVVQEGVVLGGEEDSFEFNEDEG